MELLLCIVEANAAAKALANTASQSLHAVDDCSCLVDCCTKVLPAALSVLEGAASTSEDVVGQAVECVQGCKAAVVQLQAALESLNCHDSEGVLGVLLEHPAAWLDTYRGFRGLTAQLLGISCFVRAAAQRGRADDADEGLQESIKALLGTCDRAREAANLIGRDLPEFARAAAGDGWSLGGVRLGTTAVGAALPCRRCGCKQGACGCGGAVVLAGASAVLLQHQPQQGVPAPSSQQQQRMGFLRRIGKAAACSSPVRRGSGGSPDQSYTAGTAGCAAAASHLNDAAYALMSRIQDLILYDSEVDQLEQDRAYLQQRVTHLQEFCCSRGGGGGAVIASGGAPPADDAAATAAAVSLIQSEVLLAAVDLRLKSLSEPSDYSSGEAWRERLQPGDAAVVCAGGSSDGATKSGSGPGACTDGYGSGVLASRRTPARSDRLVDPEDLYDDVRKRRSGLRWLPVCFVGA